MNMHDLIADHEAIVDAPVEAGGDPSPAVTPDAGTVDQGSPSPEAAPPTPADPFAEYGLAPDDVRDLAELLPLLRQAAQAPAQQQAVDQPEGPPEFDPFDAESMSRWQQWNNQQLLNEFRQMVAPLTQDHQTREVAEANERALDILRDDATKNGEFAGGDQSLQVARNLAETLLPQYQERYGYSPRAAEAALAAAASQVRQLENDIAKAAVERHTNQLATLAGARREPGVGSAAPPVGGEYKDEMEAVQAFMAKLDQTPNVGV